MILSILYNGAELAWNSNQQKGSYLILLVHERAWVHNCHVFCQGTNPPAKSIFGCQDLVNMNTGFHSCFNTLGSR
jgi:hypothetical protein